MERQEVLDAMTRAGKRALIHLIQAAIEGVKAVEAVIDEMGNLGHDGPSTDNPPTERIDIE